MKIGEEGQNPARIFTDKIISERKWVLEQLRQKDSLVKATLESLPYPFYVIDANDYSIILGNSIVYQENSSEKLTCYAFAHKSNKPCDNKECPCPLSEVKRTRKPVIVEHTHYDKVGKPVTVEVHCYPIMDSNGNVIQAIEYYLDITERKQAENAIRESEAGNRAILDAIPDMIFRLSEDGIILGFKPSKDIEMATAPEEFLGRKIISIYPAELGEQILRKINLSKQTGATQILEYRLLVKDTIFEYEARLIPIENNEILCVVRDITDFKRAEGLRIENEKLMRSSKAKSEFLATMSHELRTPLNSIIGFSTLLDQSGQLKGKHKHYVENVITSANHLLGLIDDILDLSKVEAGKMEIVREKISVPAIIEESVSAIKEKATRQNVNLKIVIDPQLDFIETDSMRFKQILFNLLSNAVKFSKPEGGEVTVISKKEGEMAKFSVSDTGIGIKEEDKVRLFMAFEQMDSGISRKYGGTGLGLAITRKLLEIQGGKIIVDSKYGEGSTFSFYLPTKNKVIVNE